LGEDTIGGMQALAAELVLDRMVRAVQNVRNRLLRATAALDAAGVPYVVIGGNAVAAWVGAVDKAAVRNTPDIDILIRRPDLATVRATLEAAGFVYRRGGDVDMFLDGVQANDRDSIRLFFVGDRVSSGDVEPNPDVEEYVLAPPFRVLNLGPLVRMSLASCRTVDRVHIRDLIDVGLVDNTWPDLLSGDRPELADRLRTLLANPDG
jgi:hypothetical protein